MTTLSSLLLHPASNLVNTEKCCWFSSASALAPFLSESLDEGGFSSILRHHLDAPVMDVIAGWQAWVSGKEGESESDGGVRAEG